ncbi:MAG: TIGR00730 family Rossman fold protein [Paracoccaceae bacterium]
MPYSVCVYCGSRFGTSYTYRTEAQALGTWLAENDMRLVYGAGDVGLMGEVARAAQAAGGITLGVIPAHLQKAEVAKTDLTQYIVTETMHERKKVMFMNADAVVALPGGAGTLDELFEVLTWRQLGLHAKPVFLLNTEGYWDDLVTLINGICEKGFAADSLRDYYQLVGTVGDLATRLRSVRQLSQV